MNDKIKITEAVCDVCGGSGTIKASSKGLEVAEEPCMACQPVEPPKPTVVLKPVNPKGHTPDCEFTLDGSACNCGYSGKEPKAEDFEQWFTMEGQGIIGHYDAREEALCRLVWEARQEEIDSLEAELAEAKAELKTCDTCERVAEETKAKAKAKGIGPGSLIGDMRMETEKWKAKHYLGEPTKWYIHDENGNMIAQRLTEHVAKTVVEACNVYAVDQEKIKALEKACRGALEITSYWLPDAHDCRIPEYKEEYQDLLAMKTKLEAAIAT